MKVVNNGVVRDATEEEIASYNAAHSEESKLELARLNAYAERAGLLAETDWMALSDRTLSPEWATYRQALRDITTQAGFPQEIVWPTKPE